jgi:hypothetical protein
MLSRRVHSRYERHLLDTAIGGCEVVICLVARRFLCLSPDCAKKTFAKQVSGLTSCASSCAACPAETRAIPATGG